MVTDRLIAKGVAYYEYLSDFAYCVCIDQLGDCTVLMTANWPYWVLNSFPTILLLWFSGKEDNLVKLWWLWINSSQNVPRSLWCLSESLTHFRLLPSQTRPLPAFFAILFCPQDAKEDRTELPLLSFPTRKVKADPDPKSRALPWVEVTHCQAYQLRG